MKKREFRGGLEGLSEWRNEEREVAKDLPEDAERLGPTPRGLARPPLTHSSHRAH